MAEPDVLPNRQWELIVVSIVFLALGSAFTIWRVVIRAKVVKWLGLSD